MEMIQVQFEGILYNEKELFSQIEGTGGNMPVNTVQLIATLYQRYGVDLVRRLRGEFAFSIVDRRKDTVMLFRDRLGVETIYYRMVNSIMIYSASLEKIMHYKNRKNEIDREGICELFGMGPARTPGRTPIKDVYELPAGCVLIYNSKGLRITPYWRLETMRHDDSLGDTIQHTKDLLEEAIHEQAIGEDAGFGLSGGLDSSYLTAFCRQRMSRMDTYSLDFPESTQHFVSNDFQPELDRPYVDVMVNHLHTNHHYITCDLQTQVEGLLPAMRGHGLPCMADIQSSLDFFCKEVGKDHSILVTGECADEIFGGYPWFHRKEMIEEEGFCWSLDTAPRELLLREEVKKKVQLEEYRRAAYEKATAPIVYLPEESREERMLRKNAYLTIYYFMQTLIRRTAVSTKMAGIRARIPFADPTLVEYVFNIPWGMKKKDGVRKYILRKIAEEYLPERVCYRPKSPYPKNQNPAYGQMLREIWKEELRQDCPILQIISRESFQALLNGEIAFDRPWFGQLMRAEQMLAYLWQINAWLKENSVDICLD